MHISLKNSGHCISSSKKDSCSVEFNLSRPSEVLQRQYVYNLDAKIQEFSLEMQPQKQGMQKDKKSCHDNIKYTKVI